MDSHASHYPLGKATALAIPTFMSDSQTSLGHSLQVNGLESLVIALAYEAKEMRKEKDRALESRTILGHFKNSLGYGLSGYCIVRSGVLVSPDWQNTY